MAGHVIRNEGMKLPKYTLQGTNIYPTLEKENHRLKSAGWDGICDRSGKGTHMSV